MNILYCGDGNIKDGLIISILSLLKNVNDVLNVYVLTINYKYELRDIKPVTDETIDILDRRVKETNKSNFVKKFDVTELFKQTIPTKNMETRFTPCCMLRLYADLVPELPSRLLYLDNDVICRLDCSEFYNQDIEEHEVVGVLDYYGKVFFRKNAFKYDYMNSGVLLLNLDKIKETGLFEKCRYECQNKKMFMPDQTAINNLSLTKKIVDRKYNEQRKLHDDTVLQHFSTGFRLFPWIHTVTVKPWQIDRMHEILKLHEYDDILEEYKKMLEKQPLEIKQ